MASELDRKIAAIQDRLTGPGGPLEITRINHGGQSMPAFRDAPPSLPAWFARFCAQHGEAPFLVDGATRLSFAGVYAAAQGLAGALVAGHGVSAGERVGIAARNSASWVIAYMAVLMAGGCAALLNGWWTGEELAGAIRLAGCRLVLADDRRAERLASRQHGARILPFAHTGDGAAFAAVSAAGGGADTQLPMLGPDDLALLLYTSGSTGVSKGAVSDHRAVVQAAMNFLGQSLMAMALAEEAGSPLTGQASALVCVPLFHATGQVPLLIQSFALGRRLVMMPRWDPLEAMRLIEAERITYFLGVPLMSHEIASHPERHRFDLSSCRHYSAGGAARPVAHVEQLRAALPGAYPLVGYGLTETNAVGCGNFNENYLAKPASAGPATRPLVELAIIDDAGLPLPQGDSGEVAIRSVCNFRGYWNDPEATAAAFTADGFVRTGDTGWLDEDGYLFITGRKKDIVIRGGENISCLEVEQALYAHPGVAEVCVFGLPDARAGEIPVAVWLPCPGAALGGEMLRAYLAKHIAAYKIPVHFWQAPGPLPRLASQKIDKLRIRQAYASAKEVDTERP